jgi:hypothetical protein
MAKTTKLVLTLEAEIPNREIYDRDTLITDLKDELMKVKSGLYENHFYGYITNVVVVPQQKVQRA